MTEVQHEPSGNVVPVKAPAKTPSIEVTAQAVEAVARQMKKRGTPEASLRLGIRGGGCSGFSYVIEFHDGAPHARDRVFAYNAADGTPVRVVVDPKSLLYLDGTVLEWEQTLMRQGFKFTNPNEKAGCGCGHSFSV
jgi:iron-sulfur cluster assembly protein